MYVAVLNYSYLSCYFFLYQFIDIFRIYSYLTYLCIHLSLSLSPSLSLSTHLSLFYLYFSISNNMYVCMYLPTTPHVQGMTQGLYLSVV